LGKAYPVRRWTLSNPDASDGSPDFQQELLAIRQDPPVRRIALSWAKGDADRAEDALQTAYLKVAAVADPERIENLRAYYLRVLKNEITGQYALSQPVLLGDLVDVPDPGTTAHGPALPRPVDATVFSDLCIQALLKRLEEQRDCLLATTPARSDDPGRYRATIYAAAVQIVRDAQNGVSDADSNEAFRAAYPEYFAQPDASANLLHQRFSRGRADVKALLRRVARRDELT
jgi:DNA-directed RNA polymerase specialized sigma24 family protein